MKPIVLVLGLILAAPVATPALADDPAILTVTGRGEVQADPDMATISLGVVTRDAAAADALSRNSARMARIFEVLRGAGIAEADMQTTRFDLAPVWQDAREGGGDPAGIEAYRVTNALAVIVRDIDALGEVLDAVAEAGANEFRGISFGLQEPGPLTDEARIAAVEAAQARATLYAEAAGVTLGDVLELSEQTGPEPRPQMMEMATRSAVPVAEGALSLTAQVTITYEIENRSLSND
ncbi:MAG: SIMPL domain-containing protein [Dinoroseobacter sp.]|jgi:uncharacterized protein YggE|nr:SIMPL domain-containing protein [Dinoroseobacter sp.]